MDQTLSLILVVIKSPVIHVLIGALLGFLASNNIENRRQKKPKCIFVPRNGSYQSAFQKLFICLSRSIW